MRLSARAIVNYANINQFSYGNQWVVRAGDSLELYFQIIDLDQAPEATIGNAIFQNQASLLSNEGGLRYLVGVGTANQPFSVQVIFPSNTAALNTLVNASNQGGYPAANTLNFPNIDQEEVLAVNAVQADPNDSSIWKVSIPSGQIPNSGNVLFAITEGGKTRRFSAGNLISVEMPGNDGGC